MVEDYSLQNQDYILSNVMYPDSVIIDVIAYSACDILIIFFKISARSLIIITVKQHVWNNSYVEINANTCLIYIDQVNNTQNIIFD